MQAFIFTSESSDKIKILRDAVLNVTITGGVEISKISGICDNLNGLLGTQLHAEIRSNITQIYTAYWLYVQNVDTNENGTYTVSLSTITNLMSDYMISTLDDKQDKNYSQLIKGFCDNNNYQVPVIDNQQLMIKANYDAQSSLLDNIKKTTENTPTHLIAIQQGLQFTTAVELLNIPSTKTVSVAEVITFELPVNRHIVKYPKDQPTAEVIGTIAQLGRTTTTEADSKAEAEADVARWKSENQPIPAISAQVFEINLLINSIVSIINTTTNLTYTRRIKSIQTSGELINIETYRKES